MPSKFMARELAEADRLVVDAERALAVAHRTAALVRGYFETGSMRFPVPGPTSVEVEVDADTRRHGFIFSRAYSFVERNTPDAK